MVFQLRPVPRVPSILSMTAAVRQHIGGEPHTYVSPIAPHGARVISKAGPTGPARQV